MLIIKWTACFVIATVICQTFANSRDLDIVKAGEARTQARIEQLAANKTAYQARIAERKRKKNEAYIRRDERAKILRALEERAIASIPVDIKNNPRNYAMTRERILSSTRLQFTAALRSEAKRQQLIANAKAKRAYRAKLAKGRKIWDARIAKKEKIIKYEEYEGEIARRAEIAAAAKARKDARRGLSRAEIAKNKVAYKEKIMQHLKNLADKEISQKKKYKLQQQTNAAKTAARIREANQARKAAILAAGRARETLRNQRIAKAYKKFAQRKVNQLPEQTHVAKTMSMLKQANQAREELLVEIGNARNHMRNEQILAKQPRLVITHELLRKLPKPTHLPDIINLPTPR